MQYTSIKTTSLFILLCFISILIFFSCMQEKPKVKVEFIKDLPETLVQTKLAQADSLHTHGVDLYVEKKYKACIDSFQMAMRIRRELSRTLQFRDDTTFRKKIILGIIKAQYNMSEASFYLGQYDKSKTLAINSIHFLDSILTTWGYSYPYRKGKAYHILGWISSKLDGIEAALQNYNPAIFYYTKGNRMDMVADVNLDLSLSFLNWRDGDSTISHSYRALKTYRENNYMADILRAYINLGGGYELQNNLDLALFHQDSAHLLLSKYPNDLMLAKVYHNKSIILWSKKENPSALQFIDEAISINEKYIETRDFQTQLAGNYSVKADIYFDLQDYQNAHFFYEKSIENYLRLNNIFLVEGQVSYQSVLNNSNKIVLNRIELFEALEGLAKTKLAKGQIDEAYIIYEATIQKIEETRSSFHDNASKIQLAGIVKRIYEGALKTTVRLNRLEKAFHLSENSKVYTLLEGMRHYKAMNIKGLEKELKEEKDLQKIIAALEIEFVTLEDGSLEKGRVSNKILQKRDSLNRFYSKMKDNPQYQTLVMNTPPPDIQTIQNSLLKKDQALIEYFVGEDSMYAMLISKDTALQIITLDCDEQELDYLVDKLLSNLRKEELKRQKNPIGDQKLDPQNSHLTFAGALYEKLFAPLSANLKEIKNLIIIPDGKLNNLPFEVLVDDNLINSNRIELKDCDYLVKDYTISYCYSASLLRIMQSADVNQSNRILAYAPKFDDHPGFANLFYNEEEVNSIKTIFKRNCTNRKDSYATLVNFMEDLENDAYGILHLSTHGFADDNNPNDSYIAFTPKPGEREENYLLSVRDLYTLRLPFDLIVLSACETNKGVIRKGEGIMSFTRGLASAGAKGIISTLWSVNDRATSDFMIKFYSYLNKGLSKDLALAKAKRDMLKRGSYAHPYFWAAFIPIGAM